ncbi:hypothetical protein [Pseudomonas sp. lyk4-R2A-10]|uniref:hypothetical protein n=1 Tax=Pseudomonas sp. lyk4-R2A-10 TaxID=3040315 RepID=UPI002554667D|nr:hypothetical protein [Pseudomonas sp. lyk4-R2A-10]
MPTENKTAEPLPTLVTGKEPKPYPDRLYHIDYTTHPHRCGCLSGDEKAQRRFDEYQRDTRRATAEGEVGRLTAERDALQQRLNAADQRIDELTTRQAESRTISLSGCEFTEDELVGKAVRAVTGTSRRGTLRWVAMKDAFCVGSGVAHALCRRFGFDPDETVQP